MIKGLLFFVLGLLCFQTVTAQQDTLVYLLKNSGAIVSTKDSADYVMFVLPSDSTSDGLFRVQEYYFNGKMKLNGLSYTKRSLPIFQGRCISYFDNGHKKEIVNYNKGIMIGDVVDYYPNGKLYSIRSLDTSSVRRDVDSFDDNMRLNECRDSTGKVLAENGNGHWIMFDNDFKYISDEGNVIDGIKDAEWHGQSGDSVKYVCVFNKGVIIKGTGYDRNGVAYQFSQLHPYSGYVGGMLAFYKFLEGNVIQKIMISEDEYTPKGRLVITLWVEKDGSVDDVKVLKEPFSNKPNKKIDDEIVNAIMKSTLWRPYYLYGIPFRKQYTASIKFSTSSDE